jgi:pSer/pThr/pTyr-binding forkhead associated (FHA) protein
MKLSLVVVTAGKMRGRAVPVRRSPFLIGRDDGCHLRPSSSEVSRQHCAILLRGARAFVRDLDSTNGTRINGEFLVGETELRDYDRLTIGPLHFNVRLERDGTPLPSAEPVAALLNDGNAAIDVRDTLPSAIPIPSKTRSR